MFFTANQIPEERQVAVLLSVIGSAHFSLLSSLLLAPDKTVDKSVAELLTVRTFCEEESHNRREIQVYNHGQQAGESTTQYAAELRHLAIHCKPLVIFSIKPQIM